MIKHFWITNNICSACLRYFKSEKISPNAANIIDPILGLEQQVKDAISAVNRCKYRFKTSDDAFVLLNICKCRLTESYYHFSFYLLHLITIAYKRRPILSELEMSYCQRKWMKHLSRVSSDVYKRSACRDWTKQMKSERIWCFSQPVCLNIRELNEIWQSACPRCLSGSEKRWNCP